MIIYTLYLKIHRITGLRYLGQTKSNALTYSGSGVDWKQHLKEYGNEVDTEILLETTDKEERNNWGKYYSKLWNVVSAVDDFGNKIYANRITETGGGGGAKSEQGSRNIAAANRKKATNPEFISKLKGPKTKEHRAKLGKWTRSEKHKENLRAGIASSNRTYDAESVRAKKLVSEGKHNFQLNDNPNKTILTCPHCNQSGSKPGMIRWHFNHCRNITY